MQAKNENRHGDTRVSYATDMNVDLYDRRIRMGPGLTASIGLVEGSGDSKSVVRIIFTFTDHACSREGYLNQVTLLPLVHPGYAWSGEGGVVGNV